MRDVAWPQSNDDFIAQLQRDAAATTPVSTQEPQISVALHSADPRAYFVGQTIVRLDRELRRAAAAVRLDRDLEIQPSLRTPRTLSRIHQPSNDTADLLNEPTQFLGGIRPVSADEGSLLVTYAQPGSADVLFDAVGAVRDVLSSSPVAAIVTAANLAMRIRQISIYFGKLSRRRAQTLGAGDIFERIDEHRNTRTVDGVAPTASLVRDPNGVHMHGAQITTFETWQMPDGTVAQRTTIVDDEIGR